MSLSTREEISDNVILTAKQDETQVESLVNDLINLTLHEINNPGWAFPRENFNHLWSWLRRKTSFSTTTDVSDYVLERDIDKVAIVRQTNTPIKLTQVSDELFFELIPNPTATGSPRIYRLWAIDGVSTKLSSASTLRAVSSSSSDGSSFSVTLSGYVSGRLTTEVLTLNGSTQVSGSVSFDVREIFASKSGKTTGNITISTSGGTTLVILGSEEASPRFRVMTLYPTPSSSVTIYVEYYKRIKELVNDSDVAEFDQQFHYIIRLGALSKLYQYLGKTNDYLATHELYKQGVRAMVAADRTNPDYIEYMRRHHREYVLNLKADTVVN